MLSAKMFIIAKMIAQLRLTSSTDRAPTAAVPACRACHGRTATFPENCQKMHHTGRTAKRCFLRNKIQRDTISHLHINKSPEHVIQLYSQLTHMTGRTAQKCTAHHRTRRHAIKAAAGSSGRRCDGHRNRQRRKRRMQIVRTRHHAGGSGGGGCCSSGGRLLLAARQAGRR